MEMPDQRIKVLHLIESGGMYGAENVIINLSEEMSKSGDYEPIVGCVVNDPRKLPALSIKARQCGIRTELFPIKNWRLPIDYIGLLRQLKYVGADIIHSHGYKPSVFAYLASKIVAISATATCHLWYVDDHAPFKMRLMISLEKAAYRQFSHIFAVSDAIRETLIAAGVDPRNVHVVKNGIPLPVPSTAAIDEQQVRAQFGVGVGDICVVTMGRLTYQKSHSTIIDAAGILRKRGRSLKFVIAGDGELRVDLQRHITEDGLHDNVLLVGFVDRVDELMSIASVFVLPSLDEGMPISLLEAVARNVPVVATRVGAIENVIKDRDSGLLIGPGRPAELAAAIEEIVDHPEQSKSFTERAYALLASGYSSAAMFQEYDHYYRLIDQERRGSKAKVPLQ